jgi:hypothetical protein
MSPRRVDVVEGKALATFDAGGEHGEAVIQATTGEITATTRVQVGELHIHLPLILRGYPQMADAPDLVVDMMDVTADGAQVVIKNPGNGSVRPENPFWVDLYVAPDPAPTHVNQLWDSLGDEGLTWGIPAEALPLDPGEVISLTYSNDPTAPNLYCRAELSSFPGSVTEGTPVYAQVDSWHPDTTYGAVLENHEMAGGNYNNILGPVYSIVTGMGQESGQIATPGPRGIPPVSSDGLPSRP